MISEGAQRDRIRKYSKQACYALQALLGRHMDELIKLAEERAMGAGLQEYGDTMWHKSLEQLKKETLEELADGIVYQAVYHWKKGNGS